MQTPGHARSGPTCWSDRMRLNILPVLLLAASLVSSVCPALAADKSVEPPMAIDNGGRMEFIHVVRAEIGRAHV